MSFQRVTGHLRERYVIEKTADEYSATTDISNEDLRNTRNDVIAFRSGLFFVSANTTFEHCMTSCCQLLTNQKIDGLLEHNLTIVVTEVSSVPRYS